MCIECIQRALLSDFFFFDEVHLPTHSLIRPVFFCGKKKALFVAEAVQGFITLMDSLRYTHTHI